MINLNSVVVVKHFQCRVETLFSKLLLTYAKPIRKKNIRKLVYYALTAQF